MTFRAELSGRNEVPPVISSASGEITAVLDGNELTLAGSFAGLRSPFDPAIAGGAHIHLGYAGENGGIALSLTAMLDMTMQSGSFDAASNTFTLTNDQVTALMARRMYVNIHTSLNPGGELRGQLLPIADEAFAINLSGSNEVPAVFTNGSGALALELNGDQLTVTGAFSDLDGDFDASIAGGAHLHLGLPGQNRPLDILLNASPTVGLDGGIFSASNNTFTLSEAQVAALLGRRYYANIHTTAHPSGELRGQVTSAAAQAVFRAHLSGSNEVPAVTSYAAGVVQAEVIGDSLVAYGAFADLESPVATGIAGGAHIHTGRAGENGGIAIILESSLAGDQLSGTFPAMSNRFALDSESRAALFERGLYVNIHTEGNPSGELRGQLLPEAQAYFTGVLGGIFEVPPVATSAVGAVKAELRGNQLTVSGAFSGLESMVNLNIAGGAHLHLGLAGSNGPVEFPLNIDLDGDQMGGSFAAADNTFMLSEAQVEAVLRRGYYVNIHSLENSSGELRGQLLPEARYYMAATLSGASEVPAVNTPAIGQVLMEVESNNIVSSGAFMGLQTAFDPNIGGGAHLHNGLAGENGGIAVGLSADVDGGGLSGRFEAVVNTLESTAALREQLRDRGFYVNIHTEGNPSGELRGQTLPIATAYYTTSLDAFNEVPVAMSGATGGLKLELAGDQLTVSGAFGGLQSEFDVNIAGGAHLHIGVPGENGGVDLLLNASLESDNLSGRFLAMDNTFTLTVEQVANLQAGNYYANLHTTDFPGGELRGQILDEINFFPTDAPEINFPPDGADLTLEGGATTEFAATWSMATDVNPLAYVWQLSTDEDFEDIVFQQNVGAATAFVTDFETVDGLLASLGVALGQPVTVYHRAVASDGAVSTFGPGAAVTLTRGEILADLFEARLSGHNEVLPIATNATGFVSAGLNGNELTVTGAFEGLSSPLAVEIAMGAHLHVGYAGQNGPVQFPLTASLSEDSLSGAFSAEDNTFILSNDELELLRGRQIYVNIHSLNFPGGELRGQLVPVSESAYSMSLFGSNEVPSVLSSGFGALVLEVHDGQLTVSGAFSNLDGDFNANIAGGAHLHVGQAGENGGIELGLNADVDEDLRGGIFRAEDNTFELTEALRDLLAERALYANIHTTLYPSGELRGQLLGQPRAAFRAHLSGSNENPVVTSMAGGAVIVELVDDSTLTVSGTFSGLESPLNVDIAGGAHIHLGMPGSNGGIELVLNITPEGDRDGRFLPAENTFTITEEQRMALMRRAWYVNVHSMEQPGGEVRGQLMLESQAVFTGFLSGIFEVPEAATSALGAVQAELSGNRMTLAGSFSGLSSPVATDIAGGAHLHEGMAGATGGVLIPLAISLADDGLSGVFPATGNTYELDEAQIALMKRRALYLNLHSMEIPSGELRSQLLPEARTYFYAPLSGASEVPAVNTSAGGALVLEINPGQATASGTFNELGSVLNTAIAGGAHIHLGYAGQNGPVINVLDVMSEGTSGTFPASSNTFQASSGWVDSLRQRNYYVNVHSMDEPSGELRGQLLPLATTYFTTSLSGFNEVQPVSSMAVGGVKAELTGNTLTLTGAFSGLMSPFNEMVAGGAHLHLGRPGENGGVEFGLAPTLDADELGGLFLADDNVIELTGAQAAELRAGGYYVNIHTTEVPSGELRGQVLAEINRFPSAEAGITSPPDGASVAIEGDPDMTFVATWDEAEDRDALAYIWQLAADENFENVLVEQNVAGEQRFETTFSVVDQILMQAGVQLGQTVSLYHRAVASDGSVATPGMASTVALTRGMIVSTFDFSAADLGMRAFPTLTRDRLTVEITSNEAYNADLLLSNANGQVLNIRPVGLSAGTITEQLEVSGLPAGNYFLQLVIDGQLVQTGRFIVGR